jgi:hypothetical protein
MKKHERILQNIADSKELQKSFKKLSHWSNEDFKRNAERYIKAIKDGRMCCIIPPVSASGMSRNIKYMECAKGKKRYYFYNFYALFVALGFEKSRSNNDAFIIHGCGMDMNFDTNYRIIHRLHRLGFITKKECDVLCQQTPTII